MAKKHHSKLWLYFTGIVFATIALVFLILSAVWFLLFRAEVVPVEPHGRHAPVLLFFLGSLLLGCVIAIYVGKRIIRPIEHISDAFDELSRGNFSVTVSQQEPVQEIREMAQRFNAMTHDLSHIETLRTDFVANVSHEFKTPLSSIEGYATLLQNQSLSPEKRGYYIQKILDNTRKLSDLSSDILMLSKLENQQIVPGSQEFRLDEQLRRTILLLEGKWAEKDLEFDLELPRQMYEGNEALLERVWSNILDNAIKYSHPGDVIHVALAVGPKELSVTIRDEGEGMSPEIQRHIFEKFYQGDPSRKAQGNGLGLALVKRIVELCHGRVSVSSQPGAGATFTVNLPL